MSGAPGVTLRPAVEQDAPGITALWETGWHDAHDGRVPDTLSAHRTSAYFAERAGQAVPSTTVAVDGPRVLGFVVRDGDEVGHVYVDAAARGTGLATALLQRVAADAAAQGETSLWLAVVPDNTRARRFYARLGWVDEGPFTHVVPVPGGAVDVPCHRYVLTL